MPTLIILILIITYILVKYFKIYSGYWHKRNVTQVNGILYYGTLWKFLKGKQSLSEVYKKIYDANPNLPYIGLFVGTRPALLLRDIKNIQAVLHGDFKSFYARGFIANATDLLTDNLLLTEDYKRWKLLRQKVSPYFTNKNFKNMFDITERCATDFIEYIDENHHTESLFNVFYSYIASCMSSAVFGIKIDTRKVMKMQLNEMASNLLTPTLTLNLKFAISNISPTLFKWLNLKPFGTYEDLFIQLIKKLMDGHQNEKQTYQDFIDTCLKFEKEGKLKDFVTGYETDVTLPFLAAQAFTFVLAGIDNSVNAMHMTILELSNNPKILQKVHNEIDDIYKNNGDTFTFEDIDKLEYLEMVINETMRKFTPVGMTQRKCCKDTILPVGGVKVEKDTLLIIPIFALHRDEKYYPNPDVFDPERFSPENISKLQKCSYLPFGDGKRNCIGTRMAYFQMKTGLAYFLRKYIIKEQSYTPSNFQPSFINMRVPNAPYEIIKRT